MNLAPDKSSANIIQFWFAREKRQLVLASNKKNTMTDCNTRAIEMLTFRETQVFGNDKPASILTKNELHIIFIEASPNKAMSQFIFRP